ncbi:MULTISPECIES: TRAP transporter large permease [unclassified Dietzia]|uniref:TRAP transporter large permease n=1 Tax=unclassified Dietzia TaxID=2617939 RepID=UPI0015FE3285|nr:MULTISPECIES: TRAP transporter large permease [unclassified Dietzia]MBB1023999.1 TRAP transporter large permease [Dietzia sp. DQ12-76]MBB1027738.1 TRAP transporter large permease [Dietzia sp. DQ11-38-2]
MTALAITALLLLLILVRVPVSFAILGAGVVGLFVLGGGNVVDGVMQTVPATSVMSYSLSAVPLFILMAHLLMLSGLLDSLFDAARALVGRIRGGTAVASIGAGTAFASVSGSSTAAAATLAQTSTLKMIDQGYSPRTASGLVAVVGTLAAMIPPSIILVFYAITAEVSVGDQLIAGAMPGIIIALGLVVTLYITMLHDPASVPRGEPSTWGEKGRALITAAPLVFVFVAVVGSIFLGVATPTEAAALGSVAALILVIARKRFTLVAVGHTLVETTKSTAMIFAIIIGAHVFGHFLTETRVTPTLVAWVGELAVPALAIMMVIGIVYVVLGFFMDQIAIIALTVPVVLPLVVALGYDPIWFGIFMVLLAEVGLVTPPMGLNAFVVARSASQRVEEVFRGAFPYVIAMLVIAVIFLLFPQIVLWVPESL